MTKQVNLSVNDVPIPLAYFVESFVDHTVGGMIASLEGTATIKTLSMMIDADKVVVNLNDAVVPTNEFVNTIFRSTIYGMVSTLKGVDKIDTVRVSLQR